MNIIPQPAVAALTSGAREQFLRSLLSNPVSSLTSDQAMAQLGAPIPLVWGRRDAVDESEGEVGGVWVAPQATELRFENDDSNNITSYYQLVLSQGQVGAIQPGEFWQGAEQRGAMAQSYNGRAGSWVPGNALVQKYRTDILQYQSTVNASPLTDFNPNAGRNYTFEEFNQYIRASVTLSSRGNFVTRFLVQPVKNVIPYQAYASSSLGSGATLHFSSNSTRYLPGYDFKSKPSTTENRITVTLQEEGLDYWQTIIGGKNFFQPPVSYALNITEVNSVPLPLPAAPNYCGTGGGSYYGLSTASFSCSYISGSTDWRQQIWVFLRGGAQASRLIESGTGSSPWLPDLARYLMLATERITSDQIDTDSLTLAARFNRAMGLRFNGEIKTAVNLRDFLGRIAPLFLLEVQDKGGRLGLVPAHPVNGNYRLDVNPITPQLTINESHIIPGTFDPQWIGAADRQATALVITYRAQLANQPPYDRVVEVRPQGSAESGPFESLDLREFCCSNRHALVVGLWRQARRNYITHYLNNLQILPEYDSILKQLSVASVIRVDYPRVPSYGEPSVHSYLYLVKNIRTNLNGQTYLDLEHFPVDHDGRSLVALDVMTQVPTVQPKRLEIGGELLAPTVGSGTLVQPNTLRIVGSLYDATGAVVVAPPALQIIGTLYTPTSSVLNTENPFPALSPIFLYDFSNASTVTLSGSEITGISDQGSLGWNLTKVGTGPTLAGWGNGSNCADWGSGGHNNALRYVHTGSAQNIAQLFIVLDANFGSLFTNYNGLISSITDDSLDFSVTGSPEGGTSFYVNPTVSPNSFAYASINGGSTNQIGSVLPAINSRCVLMLRNTNSSASILDDGIQIGNDRSNSGRGWGGLVGFVVGFSSVLSSSNEQYVINYLMYKWNVS